MSDFKNMKGFEAITNFTVKKEFLLSGGPGPDISIKNIPVLLGPGAKFTEVFSERSPDGKFFSFHPYGITSVGEKHVISREELEYLLERKMITLLI